MFKNWILIIALAVFFFSCANFRNATENNKRIILTTENVSQLNGEYDRNPISTDPVRKELFWNFFTKGINTKDTNDFVLLEFINAKKVKVTLYSDTVLLKSKTIPYKIQNGYCVFRRRYLIAPVIFINAFRSTKFRIGLFENRNIITDFHEVNFGTGYFIFPYYDNEKSFNIEYRRLVPKDQSHN